MSNAKFMSLLCPGEKVTAEQLETDRQILAFERIAARFSRRGFLGGLSGMAAVGAMSTLGTGSAKAQAAPASIVLEVLNFALNLEYLEANFYAIVSTGNPIPTSLSGTPTGPLTGSPGKLPLDATTQALALALAQDEENHINDLRGAITSLGGTPINQPALNYAAKGPVTTQAQFLATARQFTAVGNGAYAGAAQLLVSSPTVLTVAAQILGAEGQHLGAVNYQCIQQNVVTAFATSPTAKVDAYDIPPTPTQYFGVDPQFGLSPARTPQQDLGIVYGYSTASTTTPPAGETMGGFFPMGFNGSVTST